MDHKETDGAVARKASVRRGRWRWAAVAAAVVGLGLGLAACGGGAPSASSSTSDPGASASGASASAASSDALKFAQCMRTHGVPDFPDPTVSGNGGQSSGNLPSNINTNSSSFQAAEQACQKYVPTANSGSGGQGPNQATQLKFAECMRSHGVTSFPDPSSNGETFVGGGVDVHSPTYQAAAQACQSLLSGG